MAHFIVRVVAGCALVSHLETGGSRGAVIQKEATRICSSLSIHIVPLVSSTVAVACIEYSSHSEIARSELSVEHPVEHRETAGLA
jgi:hypothetical protein